jgi:hypothetical protein
MKYLVILVASLILIAGLTACSSTLSATTLPTTTTAPTGMPQFRPIEVVSVTGPLPPINPGGPTVQITLKNVGQEPVVQLTVVFQMQKSYDFNFDVTASAPLTNGQSISSKQTLIGPGSIVSSEAWYNLKITASLQSGSVIEYTVQVKIDRPTTLPTFTVY